MKKIFLSTSVLIMTLMCSACTSHRHYHMRQEMMAPPPPPEWCNNADVYFEDGQWKRRGGPVYIGKKIIRIFTQEYPKDGTCVRTYTVPDYSHPGWNKVVVEAVPVYSVNELETDLTNALLEYMGPVPFAIKVTQFNVNRGNYYARAECRIKLKEREVLAFSSTSARSYTKLKNYMITELSNTAFRVIREEAVRK